MDMIERAKLVLYICMSLDGFIATSDDDISWLSIVDREGEDYGYTEFSASVNSYIVGRKTYDKVMKMMNGEFPPAKQFDCYVVSRTRTGRENGVTFFNGNVDDLIKELKRKSSKNIYCDGGGEIVKLLMQGSLIDEYIVSVIPTLLGDGKRLFAGGTPSIGIELQSVKKYESGLVQLRYQRVAK
jgi:dihydrofolate reductase